MIQTLLTRLLRRGLGSVRDIRVLVLIVLGLAGLLKLIPDNADKVPETLTGRPSLTDGDSFRLGREEIRLVGIDAPEGRQSCQRGGRDWACGREATQRLRGKIGRSSIRCESEERDQHGRVLATCFLGEQNLNRWMVETGWAVAYGGRYRSQERSAERGKRGIWASRFERPRAWRDRQRGR